MGGTFYTKEEMEKVEEERVGGGVGRGGGQNKENVRFTH